MILFWTLFVASSGFADSSGSPKRLSEQLYEPDCPASTSGRKFEELSSTNRYTEEPSTYTHAEIRISFRHTEEPSSSTQRRVPSTHTNTEASSTSKHADVLSTNADTEEVKRVTDPKVIQRFSDVFDKVCHYNPEGLFYEENGKYYRVKRGFPLLEHVGLIMGRPNGDLVAPVFDNNHIPVMAKENDHTAHCSMGSKDFIKDHMNKPIPSQYRVTNLLESQQPEINVLPHDREVHDQSSASSKKSGRRGNIKKRG